MFLIELFEVRKSTLDLGEPHLLVAACIFKTEKKRRKENMEEGSCVFRLLALTLDGRVPYLAPDTFLHWY